MDFPKFLNGRRQALEKKKMGGKDIWHRKLSIITKLLRKNGVKDGRKFGESQSG